MADGLRVPAADRLAVQSYQRNNKLQSVEKAGILLAFAGAIILIGAVFCLTIYKAGLRTSQWDYVGSMGNYNIYALNTTVTHPLALKTAGIALAGIGGGVLTLGVGSLICSRFKRHDEEFGQVPS